MEKWKKFYSKPFKLKDYLGNLQEHSELLEAIIKEKPKKILEIGTGTGVMSIFLSYLSYKTFSLDKEVGILESAEKLSKKLNGKVTFIKGDAFVLDKSLGANYFDLIFSQGFFEHFSDIEIKKLVEEQLKHANVIFISIPSIFYPTKDFGNERLLTIDDWRKILSDFHLDIVSYYGFHKGGIRTIIKNFFKKPSLSIAKPFFILIKIKK